MPFECDLTARKRKKWMLEEPEQKRQREEKTMESINRQMEGVIVNESILESWKKNWCREESITMLNRQLGRLCEFLGVHRLEIDTALERIEEENMRSQLEPTYEELQFKLFATYEPEWIRLVEVLQCLTTLLETQENTDKLYKENVDRCWKSSEKLRKLNGEYNWKGNDKDAKLNESRELQVIHDVAKDFLDSYACLRSLLSNCTILWEQIPGLGHLENSNLKEVRRVCGRYPALRCLLVRDKPDHKTWNCACRIMEETKKNSEGRPVVENEEY